MPDTAVRGARGERDRSSLLYTSSRIATALFLLGVVLLFIGGVAGFLLGAVFGGGDAWKTALAAFCGAFFAFVLSLFARTATELERREREGWVALIYVQRYLIALLPNVERLSLHLDGMIAAIEKGGWWAHQLEEVQEPSEQGWFGILDRQTLESFFQIVVRVGDTNRNTRLMNEWYDRIKSKPTAIDEPDTAKREEAIRRNLARFVPQLKSFQVFARETRVLIHRCLAEARLQADRRTPVMNLFARLVLGSERKALTEEEIQAELAKMRRERADLEANRRPLTDELSDSETTGNSDHD